MNIKNNIPKHKVDDHKDIATNKSLQSQCFTLVNDNISKVRGVVTNIRIYEILIVRVSQAMFGPTFTSP